MSVSGFPFYCVGQLYQWFRPGAHESLPITGKPGQDREKEHEVLRNESIGLLYRHLKKRYYYFRCVLLFCNFVVAVDTVYTSVVVMFLLVVIKFSIMAIAVAYLRPYAKTQHNVVSALIGMINVAQALIYIGIFDHINAVVDKVGHGQRERDIH
jgi:hypothetical protein